MDLRNVKKLIELAEETGLAELEVHSRRGSGPERTDERVRIVRAVQSIQPSAATATPAREDTTLPGSGSDSPGTVAPAPMAGTFYRAPAPGERPFVEVGDAVAAGDVLCIIESMKMMNKIESECSGEISAVLLADGTPVETGAALFRIV